MNEFARMDILVSGFFADCDMLIASLRTGQETGKEKRKQKTTITPKPQEPMKYQITSYQIVYPCGDRDTVRPLQPLLADSLELLRDRLKARHGAQHVNLSYTELPDGNPDGEEDDEE